MSRRACIAWMALWLSSWALCPQLPAAVDLPSATAKLFELGDKPSAHSLEAAQAHYDEFRAAADDPRFDYAFVLVLIKQRRYDDALRIVTPLAAGESDYLPATRAKIWLEMITKHYSAALVDLDALARRLPRDESLAGVPVLAGAPAAAGEAEQPYRDAARFMGRMIAFLEGPALNAIPPAAFAEQKASIVDRLSPGRRDAFEEGRRALGRQFGELDLDQAQTRSDAKADEQKEKDEQRRQVEQEKADLAQQESDLQAAADKIRAGVSAELADIDKALRPLLATLGQLDSATGADNRQIFAYEGQISDLAFSLQFEPDPNRRFALASEINGLRAASDRVRAHLASLNAQAAAVQAQRQALDGRRTAAIARSQAALGQLDRQEAGLRQATARNKASEKKAKLPTTGSTTRVRTLTAHLAAFTTYEEFPFEREKQRVLDSFRVH